MIKRLYKENNLDILKKYQNKIVNYDGEGFAFVKILKVENNKVYFKSFEYGIGEVPYSYKEFLKDINGSKIESVSIQEFFEIYVYDKDVWKNYDYIVDQDYFDDEDEDEDDE